MKPLLLQQRPLKLPPPPSKLSLLRPKLQLKLRPLPPSAAARPLRQQLLLLPSSPALLLLLFMPPPSPSEHRHRRSEIQAILLHP